MFTAFDIETSSQIIILAPSWTPRLKELRRWGKRGRLVCPECRQPVRVRAGEHRRRHFAHVHKADCNYGNDDLAVVQARAVLYRWLVSKLGETVVSVERQYKEAVLPRPVDLWASTEKGEIAYWIFGKELRPKARETLKAAFFPENTELPARVNWLFVHDMLRPDTDDPSTINLNTTEREFLITSRYDVTGVSFSPALLAFPGATLHYLKVADETLTTYRGLRLYHEPGTYRGRPVTHRLDEVLVAPDNGEFVHPGEHEQLLEFRKRHEAWEEEQAREQDEKARQLARRRDQMRWRVGQEPGRRAPIAPKPRGMPESSYTAPPVIPGGASSTTPSPRRSSDELAVCVHCGERTGDWWFLDPTTGTCKCRSCYSKGLY